MKLDFLIFFYAFVTIAVSIPLPFHHFGSNGIEVVSPANQYDAIANVINSIKSGETYDHLKESLLRDADNKILDEKKGDVEKVLNHLVVLLKAISKQDEHPTNEELEDLAKKFSKDLRDMDFSFNHLFKKDSGALALTVDDIKVLQDLFIENPPNPTLTNNYLEILKGKSQKVYKIAKEYRNLLDAPNTYGKNLVNKETHSLQLTPEAKELIKLGFQAIVDVATRDSKSEENAIAIYKDIAFIFKVIKDPSTYDSLQAMTNAFDQDEGVAALRLFVKKSLLNDFPSLSDHDFTQIEQLAAAFLPVLKATFAQARTDGNQIRTSFEGFVRQNQFGLVALVPKLDSNGETPTTDFFSAEEKVVLEDAITSSLSEVYFSDELLKNLKNKSPNVHANLLLQNQFTKASRNTHGLSQKADEYFKKFQSAPLAELYAAKGLGLSDETQNKMMEHLEQAAQGFNALPEEVRRELVEAYPYDAFTIVAKS